MVEELLPLIGTYGFPIFVALWFMWRMEKVLKEHTEAFNEMKNLIERLLMNRK